MAKKKSARKQAPRKVPKRATQKTTISSAPNGKPRLFDGIQADAAPCPVCLELAQRGGIQPRAVMPLPPFPALHFDGRRCCRDCQATATAMRLWRIHPDFAAARVCVANERCESFTMQRGHAELFGMCSMSGGTCPLPASNEDLATHLPWLTRNKIPIAMCCLVFGEGLSDDED